MPLGTSGYMDECNVRHIAGIRSLDVWHHWIQLHDFEPKAFALSRKAFALSRKRLRVEP